MLQAASVARVCIGVFGDPVRGVFEPRRLCDLDELECAIRSHNFIALLTFVGVPPQTSAPVHLDHKAAQSFNELVSRLTAAAANDGNFGCPNRLPLRWLVGSEQSRRDDRG